MDFHLKTHHIARKNVKGHKRWNPRRGKYVWVRKHGRRTKIRGKHLD